MRFDNMITTVLAQPSDRPDRRAAQWRQLVDLLAQHRGAAEGGEIERAFAFLRTYRAEVGEAVRRDSARALMGLPVNPDLLIFFSEDDPAIAAPILGGARLTGAEWQQVLPRLGPTARALVRHRRDLTPEVRQALTAFGPSDFVLENQQKTPAVESESQIRELVARIEAYRRQKDSSAALTSAEGAETVEGFRWETGADGLILWVEGTPRGALIGQTIASIAAPGQYGVDGQAAGAFEKRAPFRDARFSVAGEGAAAGDWRISGIPYFDPTRGNFLGYRGTARRPRLDEVARSSSASPSAGVFGTALPADSLRQLIHELRTPLNAILGFAEMIDGQYMGPASAGYRARASDIMGKASGLLSAVDDLDTAARLETSRFDVERAASNAVAMLGRLHESYARIAAERGSNIALSIAPDLPLAFVEEPAVERMFARLLAATIGLAHAGETITVEMREERLEGRPMLCLAVDRPETIEGLAESDLLDPGYSPEGDWPGAPALGLGFALRLVRNLAEASGGALLIGDEMVSLYLPAFLPESQSAGDGTG
ncbi:MAG TPA: HAMP domain-containing sensor histidine kinase [Allosphingosinicella sp.]|nr:HAMP domain-containing sensor histidine kinase [Allosphingosinicella sp.]